MGNLCVVGSHKVNGVAKIHSELVKNDLFPEYAQIWNDKFCNVTNGVTPRRWMLSCNPELAKLYTETLGSDEWVTKLDKLKDLKKYADNADFQKKFMTIKHNNKVKLAAVIKRTKVRLLSFQTKGSQPTNVNPCTGKISLKVI